MPVTDQGIVTRDTYLTTWEIREIEGAERWRAVLSGRALPLKEQNPSFGVGSKAEDTFNRGQRTGRTEPMSLTYPDLQIGGHWKIGFFLTGDARVTMNPVASGKSNRTPQEVVEWFELFAARQKVLEVTWSGGAVRVCRWGDAGFTWEPTRGGDRKWAMHWKVLGLGGDKDFSLPKPMTAGDTVKRLSGAAKGLDDALGNVPGLDATYLDVVKEAASKGREMLARARQFVHGIGDLARAPAESWAAITTLAEAARDTMLDLRDTVEGTALEYQTQYARSENLLSVQAWRGGVTARVDDNLDALFALLLEAEKRQATPLRYVPCLPGQSLVRIAAEQYGPGQGSRWRDIADANGLTGQTVPVGVSRLLIPE